MSSPAPSPKPPPGIRDTFSNPEPVPTSTLNELFVEAVDRYSERPAFLRPAGPTEWRPITYREAFDLVRAAVGGLDALGLESGDRAAILSINRTEWAISDYACLSAGIADVPIYATLTAAQVAYLLKDSGSRLVFVQDEEQLAKVLEVRAECPSLEHVVVFDPPPELPEGVVSWESFLARGREALEGVSEDAFRERVLGARPEDLATLIYTSGTTGDPKGVMLTQNNFASNVLACSKVLTVVRDDVTLSFLPLSHVLQRMVDYLLLAGGCGIAHARDITTVSDDLKVVRPTIVVSVPRLYEKVYNKVMEATGFKARLVQWAREVGEAHAEETLAGRTPGGILRAAYRVADALVFRKIRAGVGGRLRYFVSGGAPLAPDINKFFYAAGLKILEGYGLTETSPVTNVNTEEHFRIGTVGRPVPGTEIAIADDGEILVRGPQVMKGYYRNPEATAAVIDADGWFHTGDIGELDSDGFLRITDRKKDLIVTAGGKNIAPQPIENRLKTNNYVDQAVMIGDRRKFPVLLVVPSFANLEPWARAQGIPFGSRRELLLDDEVQKLLGKEIQASLRDLARFEMPKKVAFLTTEFSIEGGTLTPTQKVKRRVVERQYRDLIDSFFLDENHDQTYFVA